MENLSKFNYGPELIDELNLIEDRTGLEVSSYKFYGPDNYSVELSSSVGDMAQPQDFVDSNLQELFKNADLVLFENGSAILEFKAKHDFSKTDVEELLDQTNEDMLVICQLKLNYFDDQIIIIKFNK